MTKPFGQSDLMKKARVFGYFRISDEEQSAGDAKIPDPLRKTQIKRQIKTVQDELKRKGLPSIKKGDIYAEVASGRKQDRKEWLRLQADVMAHAGPAFVAIKSPSRWARNADAAVYAWKPLKDKGVPIFAVVDNIQTGSAKDPRPQESLWFLFNTGFSALSSDEQAVKADLAVERQLAEGAFPGIGASVYPFARMDPYLAYLENEFLMSEPKGKSKLRLTVENLTMPNGMKSQSVQNITRHLQKIRSNLTPEQFQNEYLPFREWIRNKLVELDADPWTGRNPDLSAGSKTNFYPARALMRMSGLYLKEPWKFDKPDYSFLDEVIVDFVNYLSDKDKKRRGKR